MFKNLVDKFKGFQDRQQRVADFRRAFLEAAADGLLSPAEILDLENLLQQLNLSLDDINSLRNSLARDLIHQAIQDRRVSEVEEQGILHFMQAFKVPTAALAQPLQDLQHYRRLYAAESGQPIALTGTAIIPRKGEQVYYVAQANTVEDKVVATQYVGRSSGVSVRIAKGVSYRVGQSRGQKVEKRALVTTSTGLLYVTNQRLVYDSAQKPFEAKLDKLINMQLYTDGMLFGMSNRKNPVFFKMQDGDIEGVAVMISAAVNQMNA